MHNSVTYVNKQPHDIYKVWLLTRQVIKDFFVYSSMHKVHKRGRLETKIIVAVDCFNVLIIICTN